MKTAKSKSQRRHKRENKNPGVDPPYQSPSVHRHQLQYSSCRDVCEMDRACMEAERDVRSVT